MGPYGEPTMDTNNWKAQLPPDSRPKIVNKIMATLMKHLPYSGPEGINELQGIAARFEEKVFSSAVTQNDYLRKISMKMLTMETKSQNAAGSASSIPADSNNLALNEMDNLMINNGNVKPSLPNGEPVINSGDWRVEMPPDSRPKIVKKIMDTLVKHFPYSGPEGIKELKEIAARFEEEVCSSSVNQTDYLRKISMKMLTLETKAQNAAGSFNSITGDSNNLTLDELRNHLIKGNAEPSPLKEEPAINSGDWRIHLPPDSRQKNVHNLMEVLKKHVPYSGQEGIEELRRIAISFEELIFNTALNKVDYFWKISLKMQTMEEED